MPADNANQPRPTTDSVWRQMLSALRQMLTKPAGIKLAN